MLKGDMIMQEKSIKYVGTIVFPANKEEYSIKKQKEEKRKKPNSANEIKLKGREILLLITFWQSKLLLA
jgi:hypothetical protein